MMLTHGLQAGQNFVNPFKQGKNGIEDSAPVWAARGFVLI